MTVTTFFYVPNFFFRKNIEKCWDSVVFALLIWNSTEPNATFGSEKNSH
jgi:hypothetical protein